MTKLLLEKLGNKMKKLSIIVPCYNEQESLPLFYAATQKVLHEMKVRAQYWFIDDGSEDNTLQEMQKLQARK